MTQDEIPNLTLEELESQSVHRLIELSHELLDDYIEQAAEVDRSSRLLTKWLKGIKTLKTRQDELLAAQKRGDL